MRGRLRITQVRSAIGCPPRQRRTMTGLGLRRINHTVEREGDAAILGMIRLVSHLLRVEEVDECG